MATRRGGIRIKAAVPVATAALIAGLAAGCGSSGNSSTTSAPAPSASELAPIHGKYSPNIDPANFVTTIDNPYLPFKPGTAFHFEGVKGRTRQTDNEVVLHRSKRILGVRSTVVRDTVTEHGRPVERTFDWYAQDKW